MADNDNTNVVAGAARPLPNVVASYREDMDPNTQWSVVPSAGDFNVGVDFSKGLLSVPLGGDDYSRYVQLRELVRLRVSPTTDAVYKQAASSWKGSGVTENILRVAETARVNAITRKFTSSMDINIEPDGSEKVLGKRLATAGNGTSWDKCVEFAVQNFGTKSFDQFASGVRSVNSDWSKRLTKLNKQLIRQFDGDPADLGDTRPTSYGNDPHGNSVMGPRAFQHTVHAASDIAEYMSAGYKAPEDIKIQFEEKEDERAANYGKPTIPEEELLRGYEDLNGYDVGDQEELPENFEFRTERDPDNPNIDYFGPLIFNEHLRLNVEVEGYMRRKRKARTTGRTMSHPGRILTDPARRVFGQKVKVKGGIVVVDISGSMHLTQRDIEDIVEAAPAAVILAYSDTDNGAGNPNAHILANRGWRTDDISSIERHGNGVDGTALTWAIRHRKYGEDIVWVSDGQVIGIGGHDNRGLAIECADLIRQHKIIMIPSVKKAVAAFKTGKPLRSFNAPAGPIRDALLGKLS